MKNVRFKRSALAIAVSCGLAWGIAACGGSSNGDDSAGGENGGPSAHPWMTRDIVAEQSAATSDEAREAVAARRADLLLSLIHI